MKKRLIILSVTIVVLFSCFNLSPIFQWGQTNAATRFERVGFVDSTVTASYLNLRQGPSTKYYIIGVMEKGDTVKVFGKIDGWYAVYEPKTGKVGCAYSKYIVQKGTNPKPTQKPKPTATPVPKPENTKPPIINTPVPSEPVTGITEEEQEMLNLVNEARAEAGAGPLVFDMELMKVARLKAKDMVDNNYFSHQSPTYGSPFDMMRQFDISFRTAGENIAGNRTVEGAFKAWMNSEGHRRNILKNNYNYTGIGIVESPVYGYIFVQMFIGR